MFHYNSILYLSLVTSNTETSVNQFLDKNMGFIETEMNRLDYENGVRRNLKEADKKQDKQKKTKSNEEREKDKLESARKRLEREKKEQESAKKEYKDWKAKKDQRDKDKKLKN